MAKTDPITGQRIKTGGRQTGTPNRKTTARHEAMARVNEALAAMGDDTLTGTKLLREVLRHKDTPLEVRIQCAGLVLKQETPTADETPSVTHMPPALPGDSTEAQQAVWMALYSIGPDDNPEWNAAVANIMRLIHTRKMPVTL